MVRSQNRLLLLFLTPALLMIVVFTILPALWAVYVSFTRMALAGPNALDMSFVGLRNYQKLFTDSDFYHSIVLTLQYTVFTNIGQFVIGMGTALFLNQRKVRWPGPAAGRHRHADGDPRHHTGADLGLHAGVRRVWHAQPHGRLVGL